ncbi:efflux RND transporter periplasmic adaptor subunit [Aneurinibacillus terranovensis]|uniref:efflux RND transporter periplasmic adaptor subunit n=1 Tax=Aneurinibacillus terranovensis TaxID=278991 RepID=UPI0004858497|nr:efflux RND transporter periplasmic adaptor subunit [Aneurinibacillus terranovensis]
MRKATMILAAGLCLGSIALAGCGTDAKEAFQQDAAVPVETTAAITGSFTSGPVYTGTVQPRQQVPISPKLAGKIASMMVDVGSHVQKGQTLFTLDDKDLKNAVVKAQAAVAAAQSGINGAQAEQQANVVKAQGGAVSAKSGIIQAQGAITQAQNNVDQASHGVQVAGLGLQTSKQALTDAQTNLKRTKTLFNAGAAPQSSLDAAQTAFVNAQAGYNKAQADYKSAQDALAKAKQGLATAQNALQTATSGYQTARQGVSVAQSTAGIDAARSAAEQAQVGLKVAQDTLDDATVTSPIDGIVGKKNAEVGQMASPQAPVLVVANLDTVKVLVYVPADAINGMKVGNQVQVKTVAFTYTTTGTITNISPLDDSGKGYPVEVTVPNKNLQLKAGMVVEVSALDPNAKQGILIPTSAIVRDQGKSYVFVAQNGTAKRKEIQVGAQSGSQTMVTAGINSGDLVISDKAAQLSDNAKITVEQQQ